jgi:hypothetical protein
MNVNLTLPLTDTTMTKSERADILSFIRQRDRVLKSATKQRSAELKADFEQKLAAEFSYDQDKVWKDAVTAAQEEVKKAQAIIAQRCAELGIPKEFAPGIGMGWYGRSENAVKERRAELRKVAVTRIEAAEQQARVQIEKATLQASQEVIAGGLTTEAARSFLANMPSVEALMPALEVANIQQALLNDR